jgi:hypothetical protein
MVMRRLCSGKPDVWAFRVASWIPSVRVDPVDLLEALGYVRLASRKIERKRRCGRVVEMFFGVEMGVVDC